MAGTILGLFGAMTSLLANVVGTLVVPPPAPLEAHPLNLIRVLSHVSLGRPGVDNGQRRGPGDWLLSVPGHGTLLGFPSESDPKLASSKRRRSWQRMLVGSAWCRSRSGSINCLMEYSTGCNPWCFKCRRKLDHRSVPPMVAALTHLVFGWTMVWFYPLGILAYRRPLKRIMTALLDR